MTGSFTPEVLAGINTVGTSTDGPPTNNANSPAAGAGPGPGPGAGGGAGAGAAIGAPAADSGPYATPYNQQIGPTRYAPMPPRPGTKITAKSASMLFPTSFASLATGYLGKPNVENTITRTPGTGVSSRENTVCVLTML